MLSRLQSHESQIQSRPWRNSLNHLDLAGGCVSISILFVFEISVLLRRKHDGDGDIDGGVERRWKSVLSVVHRTQDGEQRDPFANSTANYVPTSRGFTLVGICSRGFPLTPLGLLQRRRFGLFSRFLRLLGRCRTFFPFASMVGL